MNNKHHQYKQKNDNDENNDMKRINVPEKKKPKQPVSEYNNKRFEVSYNQVAKPKQQPVKREKVSIMQNNPQQNYLDQYLEDEEIIRDIPKPVNNNISNQPIIDNNTYDENIVPKQMDINQIKQFHSSNNYDNSNNFKPNSITMNMKEKDANKIVDQFFTKNYKKG